MVTVFTLTGGLACVRGSGRRGRQHLCLLAARWAYLCRHIPEIRVSINMLLGHGNDDVLMPEACGTAVVLPPEACGTEDVLTPEACSANLGEASS